MVKPTRAAAAATAKVVDLDWRALIGHEVALATWRDMGAKAPAVLILEGRQGLAKTRLAAAAAALRLCETANACGTCNDCRQVANATHPELLWLDESEASIKLDTAKQVHDHLAIKAAGGKERIVVLIDAERLTPQAANSLLKILEEPPTGARVILTTSRYRSILQTIRSRAVRWRVSPPPLTTTLVWLREKCRELGLDCQPDKSLQTLLRRVGFSPGAALAAMQKPDVNAQAVRSTMGDLAQTTDGLRILAAAEALRKTHAMPAADFIAELEMSLNAHYHHVLGRSESAKVPDLMRRRRFLRQAKYLARRGRIALNTQLLAEGWGLSG